MTNHLPPTFVADLVRAEGTPATERAAALLRLWLAGRKPTTLRAYLADLTAYGAHRGLPTSLAVLHDLLGPPGDPEAAGRAYVALLAWRGAMIEGGFAPATINRRLSSLRSLVELARRTGLILWTCELPRVRSRALRDSRGPGLSVVQKALDGLGRDPIGVRDRALLRLLFDLALRRGEVAALDRADVETTHDAGDPPEGGLRVWIRAKGAYEKEPLTLPAATVAAVRAWLNLCGDVPGPLFFGLHRERTGRQRLSATSIYRTVVAAGAKAGAVRGFRPHGLRHAAITAAAALSGGDALVVRDFARHSDVRTSMLYVDDQSGKSDRIKGLVSGTCK